jgi:hypothetical protein
MFTRICMTVGSSSYMTGLFQVPLAAARSLVPDDYFQVAEIFPEKAVFFIGTGEFRDSDIGPYKEMYVGFYTENREQKEPPTQASNLEEFSKNESKMYMWKNWVSTTTATDKMDVAGSTIFRLGEIEREDRESDTVFSMKHGEEGSIQFSTPRESDTVVSDFHMERTHYGRLHGEPSRCMLDLDIEKMVTSPGKGELRLQGKIAQECEILELPDVPLVSIWIDEMSFRMHKPVRL